MIGTEVKGRDSISVGLWEVTEEARAEICRRADIPLETVASWFDESFSATAPPQHRGLTPTPADPDPH